MAYSVNWITKVITIPTTDLVLVSGTRYRLPTIEFLAEIRRLEWEPTEGLWAPGILDHTNAKLDFAGADYGAFDDIINGYTIQFTGIATRVDIVGSNTNIVDVLIPTGIAVVPFNSVGLALIEVEPTVWTIDEKNESLQYTRKASDNATEVNLKT